MNRPSPEQTLSGTPRSPDLANAPGERLAAELEAYNRAFSELELPWRWDVELFRQLLSTAGEHDCVAAYVERNHAHLLRVYEKEFLRDLVQSAKERRNG